MSRIIFTHDTWVKSDYTQQAVDLPPSQKRKFNTGESIPIVEAHVSGNYILATVAIFKDHAVIESEIKSTPSTPSTTQARIVRHNAPFLTQLDNARRPHAACNTTCLAMGMGFYGHPLKTGGVQLEDELSDYMDRRGYDYKNHEHLSRVFREYGYRSAFNPKATYAQIKSHLASGNLVITAGDFTPSGHIIMLIGYDDDRQGFFVNDPYGEFMAGIARYDTSRSGAGLLYSYKLIERYCYSDGDVFAHFLQGKPGN
ncbi:MAG: C39 family peptidase [Desertifilum sp.]|nr:C39 family peptidase [Desertifilum sp.]